jgi:hypothetical protein
MNELFDVAIEVAQEESQHKGAFIQFREKLSGAQALAIGAVSVLALSAPVALLASRNNSPSASDETTVASNGYVAPTTTLLGEPSTTIASGGGKKSNTGKKPGLALPVRGAAPTATTIATNESSTSTVAPPAPPIVLGPPSTNAPGSVSRTIAFGSISPVIKSYGDVAFTISPATPSVGSGVVTYSSSNTTVCVVDASSGEVSVVGTGGCEISAAVPANDVYAPAVTSAKVLVSVNKANLTITASSASITFSPRHYVVVALYSGFVNGEYSSVLTTLPKCVVVKPSDFEISSNDRGTYATSCSRATSLNYEISYVGGVLVVSNRK